jgi:hypothetical protein
MLTMHRSWLDGEMRDGRNVHSAGDELLGSQFSDRLRRDLEGLSLWSLARAPAAAAYILSQSTLLSYERLAHRLRSIGARVDVGVVEGPTIWSRPPSMDESSLPNAAMQSIVSWLASEAP